MKSGISGTILTIDIQSSPGWGAVDEGTKSRMHTLTLTCAAIALDIGDQEES